MSRFELLFEPFPDEDLKSFVVEGVDMHTVGVTGIDEWYPANFFLRSARGEWIGGVYANIWAGWLHIKALWVTKSSQGQGHGTRLLVAAEKYALEKGCGHSSLETFSFQAKPFYERMGYRVFGQLDDYPAGHTKYFMRKHLGAGTAGSVVPGVSVA